MDTHDFKDLKAQNEHLRETLNACRLYLENEVAAGKVSAIRMCARVHEALGMHEPTVADGAFDVSSSIAAGLIRKHLAEGGTLRFATPLDEDEKGNT